MKGTNKQILVIDNATALSHQIYSWVPQKKKRNEKKRESIKEF